VLTAGVVLLLYGGLVGFLVINENRLVYWPEPGPVSLPAGLPVEPVSILTSDSVRIAAWVIPPERDSSRWLLVFHGNAGNMATPGRPEHAAQMRRLGLGLVAVDYRGYGESDGVPTERGLYTDARAAYDYLVKVRKVPPERIVIYGHSLGSGVAIQLATQVPAAGLIVEGAFTSVPDRGAELYRYLPVQWIARNRFPSLERIRTLRMPLLVIHGRDDSTIPIAHGRRLFEAAPEPRTFLEVAGGHDDAYLVGAREYEDGITRFLATLR
jgi:uncharacterized protein